MPPFVDKRSSTEHKMLAQNQPADEPEQSKTKTAQKVNLLHELSLARVNPAPKRISQFQADISFVGKG